VANDLKKAPLSKAQVAFLDENAPAFIAWLELSGHSVGIKMQPWQRRIVQALIRKDVITPDGQITDSGRKAWERAIARMRRRQNLA
jgi:hypothetical protein